jgi:hypothetical protein
MMDLCSRCGELVDVDYKALPDTPPEIRDSPTLCGVFRCLQDDILHPDVLTGKVGELNETKDGGPCLTPSDNEKS